MKNLILAALLTLGLCLPAVARPVAGTDVSLTPPSGLSTSARFPGFEQASTKASIMVNQLKVPAAEMLEKITPEALATRGMKTQKTENIEFLGSPAILMRLLQMAPTGVEFEKLMLVFGDEKRTVMLVASYPSDISPEMRAPMRNALMGAEWTNTDTEEQGVNLDGLLFSLQESDRLKVCQRVVNGLLLTLDGAEPPQPPTAPYMVVVPSLIKISDTDVAEIAQLQLLGTRDFTDIKIVTESKLTVDELPAYEITATAKEAKSGEEIALYQILLLDTDEERYFRALGQVDRYKFERWLPDFQTIGRSIRRR